MRRIDDPDQPRAGGQVVGNLGVSFSRAIRRREDLNRQIGRSTKVSTPCLLGVESVRAYERDIRAPHGIRIAREKESTLGEHDAEAPRIDELGEDVR